MQKAIDEVSPHKVDTSIYLAKIYVEFTPISDIISPPFSSKVSKTLLINAYTRIGKLGILDSLFRKVKPKPLLVSPVFYMSSKSPRFMFKTEPNVPQPLILREGQTYGFTLTIIGQLNLTSLLDAISPGLELPLFASRVVIRNLSVEVKNFESFKLTGDYVKFSFKTPVLLQFPKGWVRVKVPPRHSLLPIPCFLIWSLAEHWNAYAPSHLKISNVKKLAAYSNYALVEVDYSLRPVTVIYDERRRPRGFIGWVIYEHRKLSPKLSRQLSRLLEYANYVGVGRSRSIGFGIVDVETLKPIR